ncbi:MAG TPA: TonB-dependent receptor [Mucilaginibacter sp.]|jgi:hypothetical protein|nr:TonB-dependent receptor [Mucilaginibacter sp.]
MRFFYLFFLCVIFYGPVFSQSANEKQIDVNFQHATMGQVASDIESKTNYHFYYNPADVDSLRITLQATQKSVGYILEQALKGTRCYYAISGREIFITKGREIKTELSEGFFSNEKPVATKQEAVESFALTDTKKVVEATAENKVYQIGVSNGAVKGNLTLSGYVRNIKTGEVLTGSTIFVQDANTGANTDGFGHYVMRLPSGKHTLTIRALGMKDAQRQIVLNADGQINIEMQERVTTLKEVIVSADRAAMNVQSAELGATRLSIATIKNIPAVFGEADVLRVVLTLPGVTSVGEATTGFNVRGGSADQNLILLNDATIYNPAHFFGFFSAFDPDVVKDIELYKSSIPEKFGGRLSSVLDVTNREGNKNKYTGSAGIGLLTSRLSVEGPIDSGKTSFIFGGRTTYANYLLKLLPSEYKNSRASFYDLTFGISHQINEKNNIYLNAYASHDSFRLNSDTTYAYSNKTISIKWKHNYSDKLYSVITGGYDDYNYNVSSEANPVNAYQFKFNIGQANFKTDFSYFLNPKHSIDFGLSSIYYKLQPGTNSPVGDKSLVALNVVPNEQALESAIYLGDKFDISPKLTVNAGVRYSIYNYLGPQTVNVYAPGLPVTSVNQIDSVKYGNNKIIKTYGGPEIRVSARYLITNDFSVKAGYNTLRQYLHLISNTTAISPTDIYKLSDPNIKPQYGDQVSLGLYKNLAKNTIQTSVEVYYKRIKDYLDYRSGATLVLNHHLETDVLETHGKAYGVEFLIKKEVGALNGWMSYTYSRTFLQQSDLNQGDIINEGAYYPANYDKPHSFNFTGNYKFSHRYSISLTTTYSTGRPITLPIAKYYYAGSERVYYSDRNQYRIPDYFRSDFSLNIEGNHKVHQLTHNSWTIGVYNLTGRKNAYSTYFTEQGGVINGYKLSIFANPIPFVNYNIKF